MIWNFRIPKCVDLENRYMRNFLVIISLSIVCLFNSCSSDDDADGGIPTGELILGAMVGEWVATSASFTTVNTNPVLSRDVVAEGGACDLSVAQSGRFTLVIRNPGVQNPQLVTGLFEPNGEFIDAMFDSDPSVPVRWEFLLSGNTLAINGLIAYDFEDDGTLEQASAALLFNPL